MADTVLIDRLGTRGDGIAEDAGGVLYVPRALPGETVAVARQGPRGNGSRGNGSRGELERIETASADRVEPFCPYFAACGGCAAQHMGASLYADWKRGVVAGALAQAGIDAPLGPLVDAHGEGRRRITLHARFPEGDARVGYMAARSHDLVTIDHCPIAEPGLRRVPEAAHAVAARLARSKKPLDLQFTATETGFDLDIRGHGPLGDRARQGLIGTANALDLARVSVHGDVLVTRRLPTIPMGRARVSPPPGAFLQATRAGEEILAGLVVSACEGARKVADLFAGCGPFSLRLAERAQVHAVEQDAPSLAALDRAWREARGLREVSTEPRDLFRRPLLGPELSRFDAVVMDPPRAGAEAQARQLASSKVPLVAMVSCDPGTFARDAGLLIKGGYRLERVTPVDQFKYTAHVEIVGIFRRDPAKRRR